MTRVDQDTFKLIKQLTAPDKIIDKTFNDLIVKDHFHPKPSVVMERCRFHQAKQKQQESVADFAARLKKLSLNCNFEKLKVSLHDQLVCGIRDKEIRIKLFEDDNLDYCKG